MSFPAWRFLDTLVNVVDCTLATNRKAAQGTWAAEPAQVMTVMLDPVILGGHFYIPVIGLWRRKILVLFYQGAHKFNRTDVSWNSFTVWTTGVALVSFLWKEKQYNILNHFAQNAFIDEMRNV